jgi:hypothetical protein
MAFSGALRECDVDTIAVWADAGRGDPAPPGVNSVALLTSPRERPASQPQGAHPQALLEDTDQHLALGCIQSPACG